MFIQAIIGKVTDAAGLRVASERWNAEVRPGAAGFLGATMGVADDGTSVAVVRFESGAAAAANSERAEQGAWWAAASAHYDGGVTFLDCDEVIEFLDGGSDSAGFVQVLVGRVTDDAKARLVPDEAVDALRRLRPDLIGGTRSFSGSQFIEVVYFTSEAEARVGEQAELPQVVRDLDAAIEVDQFVSLSAPWYLS
jgi:hypothetical protein